MLTVTIAVDIRSEYKGLKRKSSEKRSISTKEDFGLRLVGLLNIIWWYGGHCGFSYKKPSLWHFPHMKSEWFYQQARMLGECVNKSLHVTSLVTCSLITVAL